MTDLSLSTLTLERIPALTDEEYNELYSQLADYAIRHGDGEGVPVDVRRLLTVTSIVSVCSPDCPASVLEGLPALVEKRTGKRVMVEMRRLSTGEWSVWYTHSSPDRDVVTDSYAGRHLAHACLCAAFAACVVLGRRG